MDINKLLGGVPCACGRHHTCNIKYVYIEKQAALRLGEICGSFQKILLVADENTFAAAGEQAVSALQRKQIRRVIFSGNEILVPDEEAIQTVCDQLGDAELIIGIGSGVIQDLCKYVSFCSKLPYIILATAPSMDGYASNGAAMITDGMKVTYSAGLPLAILADTGIIKNAPLDMLKAGYGDIIGKFSALNDWKLSHLVTGEYFCDYIYDMTYQLVLGTIPLAEGILNRDEESVGTLMEALVVIGILMSFAGSSRPASGSEHHLSHFFEITGIVDSTPYLPHGIDVAYSTVMTAELREKLLAEPFPQTHQRPEKQQYQERMQAIYKEVAQGCMELQERTGNYRRNLLPTYLQKESEIKQILSECPSGRELRQLLHRAGLDMDEFFRFYGKQKIEDAILYAKDLKDRYSVLWMYYDFFA